MIAPKLNACLSLIIFFFSACYHVPETNQATLVAPYSNSHTPSVPDNTTTPHILTVTPSVIPCDPAQTDYCIMAGNFLFMPPIKLPGTDSVDRSYPYGSTASGTREPHHGVEFYNPSGTPVYAALDGTVFFVGDDLTMQFSPWLDYYGNLVILEHRLSDRSIYTLYAHLSDVFVLAGQIVLGGEIIAEVGATGSAIGSHLHFEIRNEPMNYDSSTNPELWLIPKQDSGTLALRIVDEDHKFLHLLRITVQYYTDPAQPFVLAWWPETYSEQMPSNNWENAVLGNIPAGIYRISFFGEGDFYEKWVVVEAMKLTLFYAEVP